jgi:hypothetical protein
LKTKAFILEKFLDTAFSGLLRFLPESSDGFIEPPLELFSLEKKGRLVARWPFDLSERQILSLGNNPASS